MIQLPNIKTAGTLSERAYEVLKNAIIGLELKPGDLITVEEISEQLDISRTPIRTALNKLMEEDLVEMIPGKGTFVTFLTEKQAIDLLNVRELLECYAIQLAAEHRTQEDLENLEFMLCQQELTFKGIRKSQKEFLKYDGEFHSAIAQISKNAYLEKQLFQMHSNLMRYLNASTMDNVAQQAIEEHKELYVQIKNRDIKKAISNMREHINNIKVRVIDYINYNEC